MLKEAKKWVQDLETMLKDLSEEFGKSVEELDGEFENWYYDGGQQWDFPGSGPNAVEAFRREYSTRMEEEDEQKAYDDIYQKMREYADRRDYTLSDDEIETIIEQCEEEGDSISDCSDGALREIVEDWVADHSCLGKYF